VLTFNWSQDSTTYNSMGSSTNDIYTIYGTPGGGPLTHKRLTWCTDQANGQSDIDSIAYAIHEPLCDRFKLYGILPNDWNILDGDNKAECSGLSLLMFDALRLLGVPWADIDLKAAWPCTYADGVENGPQTRQCPEHGAEFLGVDCGGPNKCESCCVVNGTWYPGGIHGSTSSALLILQLWFDQPGNPYQVWYYDDYTVECEDPGPDPVPPPPFD
jgi:hypothetical protein